MNFLSLFLVGSLLPHAVWTQSTPEYSKVGDNLKCRYESTTRLFRTPNNAPLSTEQCFKKCSDTTGCQFFTLGVDPANPGFAGVCMGCSEGSNFQEHTGFSTYRMPCPDFGPVGEGIKCPYQSEFRVFRTNDNDPITMEQCYQKCSETEGCNYFSLGVDPAEPNFKGVCMGCVKGSFFNDHPGFETYEIWENCAPKPCFKIAGVVEYSETFEVSGKGDGPVLGAVITLKDENGVIVGSTSTKAPNGSFEFANLDPGIYTVEEKNLDEMQGSLYDSDGVANTNDRIEVVLTSADRVDLKFVDFEGNGRRLLENSKLRGA